jgi:hypothetical protein
VTRHLTVDLKGKQFVCNNEEEKMSQKSNSKRGVQHCMTMFLLTKKSTHISVKKEENQDKQWILWKDRIATLWGLVESHLWERAHLEGLCMLVRSAVESGSAQSMTPSNFSELVFTLV